MKNNLPKYLFALLGFLLALPMALQVLSLSGNSLGGHSEKTERNSFTWVEWFLGKFQASEEKYLSETYGLRANTIRLHNQYRFSLFGKTNVKDVVIGKQGYLFAEGYILAYTGSDHFDEKGVRMKVKRLGDVNKKLMEMGKKIVVVRAAGKASFFPEFIPDRYFPKKEKNIIDAYKKALSTSGLFYVDFNDWFLEMKDSSRYPLFPKTGIHWSEYGMVLASDSLIRFLEKIQGIDLPELITEKISLSAKPLKNDDDIEKSMNLIFPMSNMQYAYPEVHYHTEGKDSLRVLVVGDSYYWQLYRSGFAEKVFTNGHFVYYGRTVYPENKDLNELGLLNLIDESDILMLICTEANLQHLPWGIHSALYEALCKEEIGSFVQEHIDEIVEMENKIREDKTWYDLIVIQAANQKTSVEEELRRDALYEVEANHLDD